MKLAKIAIATLFLAACAHGKMGKVEQALQTGAVTKTTPIYVEKVSTTEAKFSGDKSGDAARVASEKASIENAYNMRIVDALKAKGFNASVANGPVTKGLVLSGKVTKVEHGSAAARIMVGMGAGSANMFTDFKLEDRTTKKVLSKFEVIATSGGTGGLQAAGSYLDAHLQDGSKKVAEYISGEKKD